jgi:DNA-binding transcriptional regulator YhcF (GntR family)
LWGSRTANAYRGGAVESLDDSVATDLKFSIVPEWLIDSGCTDKALRLYVVLARYADNENLTAFPSRATLARRMGCHRASVDRAIEELIRLGAVSKQHRVEDGKYQSSLYTVRRLPPSRTHATTPVAPMQRPPSHPCSKELEPKNENQELLAAKPPESVRRKTDNLFETVAKVCGITTTNLTRSSRGQLNKAVKELREIDATDEQVHATAKAYRQQYPNATLTPTALVKHWSSFKQTSGPPRASIWDTYEPPKDFYA